MLWSDQVRSLHIKSCRSNHATPENKNEAKTSLFCWTCLDQDNLLLCFLMKEIPKPAIKDEKRIGTRTKSHSRGLDTIQHHCWSSSNTELEVVGNCAPRDNFRPQLAQRRSRQVSRPQGLNCNKNKKIQDKTKLEVECKARTPVSQDYGN